MTLIVRPNSYTAGTFAVASEVNADFNTIYTGFNGNIGQANVTFTTANDGLRVWRSGPNAGGTNGQRAALLSRTWSLGVAASGNQVYTFSTDAIMGNPAFSAAPTPSGIMIFLSAVAAPDARVPRGWWLSAISSTAATLQWDRTGGTLTDISITVTFWVGGQM